MYGYESPITVFQKQIEMKIEEEILKAVCETGVVVDKEELLKALKYDREQYEKGYADGKTASRWIPCSERLPEDKQEVQITDSQGRVRQIIFNKWLFANSQYSHGIKMIAWQPLPEPYKKEGDV